MVVIMGTISTITNCVIPLTSIAQSGYPFSGWGLFSLSAGFVVPSDNLRQIQLTIHSTEKPGLIETNVGPNGEDACAGDSGEGINL